MNTHIVRKPDGTIEVFPETIKLVFVLLFLIGLLGLVSMILPLAMQGGRRHHSHGSATGILLGVCLPLGVALVTKLIFVLRAKPLLIITKETLKPGEGTPVPWADIREIFVCTKRAWMPFIRTYVIGVNLVTPPAVTRWKRFHDSWITHMRDHADIAVTLSMIPRDSLDEVIAEIGQYQVVSDRIDDTLPGESLL